MEWLAAMCSHIPNRSGQMVPKCKGIMRIIGFIENAQVIREILTHLGLWLVRSRPPPKIHDPPNIAYALQIRPHTDIIYGDPEYFWDDYIQS